MERRCTGHLVHQIVIVHQGVALLGEVLAHLLDERLPTVGETEMLAAERHHVIARRIKLRQGNVGLHLDEVQQPVKRLSFAGAAYEVHARLELAASAGEALQASAYLHPLFEHRHLIAVPRQDDATRESSQSTAYYNYFLHTVCSILFAMASYHSLYRRRISFVRSFRSPIACSDCELIGSSTSIRTGPGCNVYVFLRKIFPGP